MAEVQGVHLGRMIDRKAASAYAGVSAVTLWRWMTKGIRDPFGNRIRLRRHRRGGVLFTTQEWVDEFFAALNKADDAKWDGHAAPGRPESRGEFDSRRQVEIAHAFANREKRRRTA